MQTEDFKFLYKELMTTPGTTIFQKFIKKITRTMMTSYTKHNNI